jgi:glycerol-3-phosphate O-acyltransferase
MRLLSGPLQPAWLVGRVYEQFLAEIPVEEAWKASMARAAEQGVVVHVVRNMSLLDLLAIDHLTRRFGLPRVGFANELGAWLGPELGFGPKERLRRTVEAGGSSVLFLKRPPSVISRVGGSRPARSGSDDCLRYLLELERNQPGRIVLVPQTLVWTHRPERLGFSFWDALFGPADFPGELRAAAQLLLNAKNSVIRASEPILLRDFVATEGGDDNATLARRITFTLLRRVERERRAVLGPAQKPADRLREEVLRSPKLQAILRDLAGPSPSARALLEDKARRMLRELETRPDPQVLETVALMTEILTERVYAGVDVDKEGLERVRDAAKRGSIVLLPSHKSHVDYLLLSLMLRKAGMVVPCIAAGDNLAFFPIGPLFRGAGAFFIRRSFRGDRLYTAVVDAYIRRLMRDGHAIEFFLEGGRSRTGKLLTVKLGLLNMVVEAALGLESRTVSFVPVSIGYERMLEEGSYARELSGGPKRKEGVAALIRLGSRLHEKYGRANIQFGNIIDLADMRAAVGAQGTTVTPAKRRALVNRLALRVISEINRATAVTPGSLVAMALLCHGRRGLSHVELVDECARLTKLVQHLGARTAPSLTRDPGDDMREAAVREAVQIYTRGGLVRQHVPGDTLTGAARKRGRDYVGGDAIYTVPDEQRLMLDISKNIIIHLFIDRAFVAVAMAMPPGTPAQKQPLRERFLSLARLFKSEFVFRPDTPLERVFDDAVADMVLLGELSPAGSALAPGPGHHGLDGRGWLAFFAAVVHNFLEGYRVAARALRALTRGPLTEKELLTRALRVGEQMFLAGEIERSEAVSQPVFQNAFLTFVEQGYLQRSTDKLALFESFVSEAAVQTIESRVTAYLARQPSGPVT